jgi:hypothetical protein
MANDDDHLRRMRQLERDAAYRDHRQLLAEYYDYPFDGIMDAVTGRTISEGTVAGNPVIIASEFYDAPRNLSDPEFAAWAVDKLRRSGKLPS